MKSMPDWLIFTLRTAIIILMPVFLTLTNVRLAMSNAFLNYEYNKPNFPPDTYGFSQADRLAYAPIALDYLTNPEGVEFLGRQTFPDGSLQYNERELKHMQDVKRVTRAALNVWLVSGLIVVGGSVLLGWSGNRAALRAGLLGGAGLTLLVFLGVITYIAINFNTFFTQFHQVFFESGTWQFEYSDTLIRLFPLQFWEDVFILIGGGAMLAAVVIGVVAWRGIQV